MNYIVTIFEDAKIYKEIKFYCEHYGEAVKIREKLENGKDVIIIDPISKYGRFEVHKKLLNEIKK